MKSGFSNVRAMWVVLGIVALCLAIAGVAITASTVTKETPKLNFDLTIVPQDTNKTHFTTTATLLNLNDGKTLFTPVISSAAGQEASITGKAEGGDYEYSFSIKVDPSKGSAIYLFTITEGKKLVFFNRATIKL